MALILIIHDPFTIFNSTICINVSIKEETISGIVFFRENMDFYPKTAVCKPP
jgi:hypothetical protein